MKILIPRDLFLRNWFISRKLTNLRNHWAFGELLNGSTLMCIKLQNVPGNLFSIEQSCSAVLIHNGSSLGDLSPWHCSREMEQKLMKSSLSESFVPPVIYKLVRNFQIQFEISLYSKLTVLKSLTVFKRKYDCSEHIGLFILTWVWRKRKLCLPTAVQIGKLYWK